MVARNHSVAELRTSLGAGTVVAFPMIAGLLPWNCGKVPNIL
jgi:hypothetical protein